MIDEPRAELMRRLSHDLRSPLNVLDGALKELQSLDEPHDRQRLMSLAQRAVNRLTRLAERLTLAGRIDQGLSPVKETVDAAKLVRDCWASLQSAEPRARVGLTVEGEANWSVDRALFAATVSELLINAMKNARSTVTVRIAPGRLTVDDDGTGVDEASLPNLFTTVQVNRGGLGLGLPMAAAVAKALGLALSVERDDAGSLSRFVLKP